MPGHKLKKSASSGTRDSFSIWPISPKQIARRKGSQGSASDGGSPPASPISPTHNQEFGMSTTPIMSGQAGFTLGRKASLAASDPGFRRVNLNAHSNGYNTPPIPHQRPNDGIEFRNVAYPNLTSGASRANQSTPKPHQKPLSPRREHEEEEEDEYDLTSHSRQKYNEGIKSYEASIQSFSINPSPAPRKGSDVAAQHGINSVVIGMIDPGVNAPAAVDPRLFEDSGSGSETDREDEAKLQKKFKHAESVLSLTDTEDDLDDSSSSMGSRKNSFESQAYQIRYRDGGRAPSRPSISETDASSLHSVASTRNFSRKDKISLDIPPQIPEDFDPYTLVPPIVSEAGPGSSLEELSIKLFSSDHLKRIFGSPSLLAKFTRFISKYRPASSLQMLKYHFDGVKALKAIDYANNIKNSMKPIPGFAFTEVSTPMITHANQVLLDQVSQSYEYIAQQELPRYITWIYSEIVRKNITDKITGQLSNNISRDVSESLAEVFCLTDPSRPDNPIVMASEEFHRMTQYGVDYVVNRNCRFLQGPFTNKHSVQRLSEAIKAGKEVSEVFLNYRRDGSPFMNLLMTAPLCDSRGKVRYFIGAQCDVSQLVKEQIGLESFKRLIKHAEETENSSHNLFEQLAELFDTDEIDSVRLAGGRLKKDIESTAQTTHLEFRGHTVTNSTSLNHGFGSKHRVVINSSPPEDGNLDNHRTKNGENPKVIPSSLNGVYKNYLLVRPSSPHPIVFASPSMRTPGILQSPLMSKIGGSDRVITELESALMEGRGVTAKIRWLPRHRSYGGRERWIHATPMLDLNGNVGIWMIVVLDEAKDSSTLSSAKTRKIKSRESWMAGEMSTEQQMPDMKLYEGSLRSHH